MRFFCSFPGGPFAGFEQFDRVLGFSKDNMEIISNREKRSPPRKPPRPSKRLVNTISRLNEH